MTSNWPRVALKETTSYFNDGNWIESKDQSGDGIRLIQTGNIGIGDYKANDHRSRFISQGTFDRLSCTEVLPGDVLVSRLPDPIGRACVVPDLGFRAITGVDCSIVRFGDSALPAFFVYYSQSAEYLDLVMSKAGGSTRQRISRSNLGEIKIPLPPLDEQKRIVAKLDEALAYLEKHTIKQREIKASYEMLFEAALQKEMNSVSGNLHLASVGDLFHTSSGGTPLKSRRDYYLNGNVPWLVSGEVSNENITKSKLYITELALTETSTKIVPKNSILIAMYGATAGQVGILRFQASTNQAVCAIHPKAGWSTEFLYYWFLSKKNYMISMAAGNAQPNISQAKIRSLQIPVFDESTQIEISTRLDQLRIQIESARTNKEKLSLDNAQLRSSILSAAFAGDF